MVWKTNTPQLGNWFQYAIKYFQLKQKGRGEIFTFFNTMWNNQLIPSKPYKPRVCFKHPTTPSKKKNYLHPHAQQQKKSNNP